MSVSSSYYDNSQRNSYSPQAAGYAAEYEQAATMNNQPNNEYYNAASAQDTYQPQHYATQQQPYQQNAQQYQQNAQYPPQQHQQQQQQQSQYQQQYNDEYSQYNPYEDEPDGGYDQYGTIDYVEIDQVDPDVDDISLKEFDPRRLHSNLKNLFISPSDSGKSILLSDLFSYIEDKVRGIQVVSGSEQENHFYEKVLNIPDSFITYELDPDVQLGRLFFRQKFIEKNGMPPPFTKEDRAVHLIYDDVLDDEKAFHHRLIKKLMFLGRHSDIGLTILSQYSNLVPKRLRSQFHFIFILMDSSTENQEILYKSYFSMFTSFKEFQRYFNHYCQDYGCLVIDTKSRSSKLQDRLFWYRANKERALTPKVWPNSTMHEYHRQHYKPPVDDTATISWKPNTDASSLPEPVLTMYGTKKRGAGAKATVQKAAPTYAYNFKPLDSQGRLITSSSSGAPH